jgi:hypothetical protein
VKWIGFLRSHFHLLQPCWRRIQKTCQESMSFFSGRPSIFFSHSSNPASPFHKRWQYCVLCLIFHQFHIYELVDSVQNGNTTQSESRLTEAGSLPLSLWNNSALYHTRGNPVLLVAHIDAPRTSYVDLI